MHGGAAPADPSVLKYGPAPTPLIIAILDAEISLAASSARGRRFAATAPGAVDI